MVNPYSCKGGGTVPKNIVPIVLKEDCVVKVNELISPKKITGTRISAVLGMDKYTTPFKVWADIVGLVPKRVVSSKYLTAGRVLEPKILEYCKSLDPHVLSAKEWHGKAIRDAFPDNPVFGGIPDAYRVKDGEYDEVLNREKLYSVIDFKTTSNPQDWATSAPINYIAQTGLYAYFHGVDVIELIALDVSDYDLEDLNSLVHLKIDKSNIIHYVYSLSKDFPEFVEWIQRAEDWYNRHVIGKVSPKYEFEDFETIEDILDIQQDYKDSEVLTKLERINYLVNRKSQLDALYESIDSEIKELKEYLKPMRAIGKCPGAFGGIGLQIVDTKKDVVDKKALKEDGLLDKYVKQQISKTFKVENKKVYFKSDKISCFAINCEGIVSLETIYSRNGSFSESIADIAHVPFRIVEAGDFYIAYGDIPTGRFTEPLSAFGFIFYEFLIVVKKDFSDFSESDASWMVESFEKYIKRVGLVDFSTAENTIARGLLTYRDMIVNEDLINRLDSSDVVPDNLLLDTIISEDVPKSSIQSFADTDVFGDDLVPVKPKKRKTKKDKEKSADKSVNLNSLNIDELF